MILVSPTEPPAVRRLGKTSSIPEKMGVDIYWVTGGKKWGIQRKQFPEDFMSSMKDGRLNKELAQMAELDGAALILEGFGRWTDEGDLVSRWSFTSAQMFGMLWSMAFEFGVAVLRVRDDTEFARAVNSLKSWSEKDKHSSLTRRPKPTSPWGVVGSKDWSLHLLQSFEGVGPTMAESIYEEFGGAPLRWTVDGPKDLEAVKGVGKATAKRLWEALESGEI